jgi:hypothetical protein
LLEIIRCRHGERLSQSHHAHCVRGKCLRRVIPASPGAASQLFNDLREFAPTGAPGENRGNSPHAALNLEIALARTGVTDQQLSRKNGAADGLRPKGTNRGEYRLRSCLC